MTVYSKPLSSTLASLSSWKQDPVEALQVDHWDAEQAGVLVKGQRASDIPPSTLHSLIHGEALPERIVECLRERRGSQGGDCILHCHHTRHTVADKLRRGAREAYRAINHTALARVKDDNTRRRLCFPEQSTERLSSYPLRVSVHTNQRDPSRRLALVVVAMSYEVHKMGS